MDVLKEKLQSWDGKSAGAIKRIYGRFAAEPGFAERLIAMSADQTLETGATWLLKHHMEVTKRGLNPTLALKLAQTLPDLSGWEAKLHCLQILPYLALPGESTELVFRFVLACREDQNKFVRAWAYSGLHHLALAHPGFRTEVRALLENAVRTEQAALVKVRLRRALEQGFPDMPD